MSVSELVRESQKLSQEDLLFWYKAVEKRILEAMDEVAEKEALSDLKNHYLYKASSGSELISLCKK